LSFLFLTSPSRIHYRAIERTVRLIDPAIRGAML
jgi:hypothetical protein